MASVSFHNNIAHVSAYRNMNTFDREAFGRRSFSEKRKGSTGKNKEVVAKVKALREEMKLEATGQSQVADSASAMPPGERFLQSLAHVPQDLLS